MRMTTHLIILGLLVILSTACVPLGPVDLTAGATEKATLITEKYIEKRFLISDNTYSVQVLSVNGQEIEGGRDRSETTVYVTPGKHTVELRVMAFSGSGGGALGALANSRTAELNKQPLEINVDAGKTYLVSAKATKVTNVLGVKTPQAYEYSISEFTGTESPETEVEF